MPRVAILRYKQARVCGQGVPPVRGSDFCLLCRAQVRGLHSNLLCKTQVASNKIAMTTGHRPPAICSGSMRCLRIQQPPKQVELRLHLGCGCGPSHSERGLESRERVAEDLEHLVEGKG